MAEGETQVHPGSFVGDSIEEFKKLPTWGKFLAVGALGLVIYLAIRARQNAAAGQTAQGAAAQAAGSTPGAGQSPFPGVNGLPLLPSNVNPIYDPNGNLVGYQQGGSGTPTPTPAPGGTPPPGGGTPPPKPSDPTWYYTKNGITYHAWHGADGRIWGNTGPNTKQVLLAGPAPTPNKTPVPKGPPAKSGTGSGPAGVVAFMENPLVYWASAKPHKPASTP